MSVTGLAKMKARFRQLPPEVQRAVIDQIEDIATEWVAQMRRLAPVEDGDLAASIGWTRGDAPAGSIAVGQVGEGETRITIHAGSKRAFYARFVEFGTRPHSVALNASVKRGLRQGEGKFHPGSAAQPYFFPVIRAGKRATTRRINAAARRAAKLVWGK